MKRDPRPRASPGRRARRDQSDLAKASRSAGLRRRSTQKLAGDSGLASKSRSSEARRLGIGMGKPYFQIAEQLELSVRTVEGYRSRIMMKLEITSLAQLVRLLGA